MATYERREVTTRRVEFHVPAPDPWGAAWVEVMKAIHAATAELVEAGVVEEGHDPADDVLTIRPWDDAIVVSYEQRSER